MTVVIVNVPTNPTNDYHTTLEVPENTLYMVAMVTGTSIPKVAGVSMEQKTANNYLTSISVMSHPPTGSIDFYCLNAFHCFYLDYIATCRDFDSARWSPASVTIDSAANDLILANAVHSDGSAPANIKVDGANMTYVVGGAARIGYYTSLDSSAIVTADSDPTYDTFLSAISLSAAETSSNGGDGTMVICC